MGFLSARRINILGALVAAVLLGVGFYLAWSKNLNPCLLCLLQRWVFALLMFLLLVASVHNPKRRGIQMYGFLTLFVAGAGIFLASRQVWLQSQLQAPADICLPEFSYVMSHLPLKQVFSVMVKGADHCGSVEWMFWGWSIAAWSLMCFVLFAVLGIFQIKWARFITE
jgi:disulfide bond formation protein DsbB